MNDEYHINSIYVDDKADQFPQDSAKSPQSQHPKIADKSTSKENKIQKLLAKKAKISKILAKKSAENSEIDRQLKWLKMSKKEREEYQIKLDERCRIIAGAVLINIYNSGKTNITKENIKNAIIAACKTYEEIEYFEKKLHD